MITDEDEVGTLQTYEAFDEGVAGPGSYIIALPVKLLFANEAVENMMLAYICLAGTTRSIDLMRSHLRCSPFLSFRYLGGQKIPQILRHK